MERPPEIPPTQIICPRSAECVANCGTDDCVLYGLGIKVADSQSLAVSLPRMLVPFARYSRDASFEVLRLNSGWS